MPRHDDRYEATPGDVLRALRFRNPDPFRHNETPHTDFTIASMIVSDRGIKGHPLGRAIQRGKLVILLEEMARDGRLVQKTSAEWSDLGRTSPSRSKMPLYTTPERATAWGISVGIPKDRWTVVIEFDDLETQEKAGPELAFPHDECSRLVAYLIETWGMLPEDFQEIADWTSEKITLELEQLEFVATALNWIGYHAVPKTVIIERNETR